MTIKQGVGRVELTYMNPELTADGYCLLLNRVARAISRFYNHHLRRASLTVGQYCILATVLKGGPITLRDLGNALVIERSALLRALKPLSTAGLLQSTADPSNQRRILVEITPSGEGRVRLAAAGIRATGLEIEWRYGKIANAGVEDILLRFADETGIAIEAK
jgi:DNA-binding MarR family transcriptional regulator